MQNDLRGNTAEELCFLNTLLVHRAFSLKILAYSLLRVLKANTSGFLIAWAIIREAVFCSRSDSMWN
jgi:hypothetical protein